MIPSIASTRGRSGTWSPLRKRSICLNEQGDLSSKLRDLFVFRHAMQTVNNCIIVCVQLLARLAKHKDIVKRLLRLSTQAACPGFKVAY